MEISSNEQVWVRLQLDRPAPFDFVVAIRVEDVEASLVSGVPAQIAFAAGSTQQEVSIKAGSREGRVRYLAEAPFSLGSDVADLKIEIED